MGLGHAIKSGMDAVLSHYGHRIIADDMLYEWQKVSPPKPRYSESTLPAGAQEYLQMDNPRLAELSRRYSRVSSDVTAPLVWTDGHMSPDDVKYFRGDNAYVWQLRGHKLNMNRMAYALTAYYVKSIDGTGLLDRLVEDEYFGAQTFTVDKRIVSRDLLDSIMEIHFLDKHLGISSWDGLKALDIGAGYGRLAHRMVTALSTIEAYYCTDAVAVSTFISEYYLRFRGVHEKSKAIPLDEVQSTLRGQAIDLALNMHSFSECRLTAIEWWLSLLEANKVRYLMIVPNPLAHGGSRLLTNDGQDFSRIVEGHGYRLVARDPKYEDPVVQQFAISPTHHYLFELR